MASIPLQKVRMYNSFKFTFSPYSLFIGSSAVFAYWAFNTYWWTGRVREVSSPGFSLQKATLDEDAGFHVSFVGTYQEAQKVNIKDPESVETAFLVFANDYLNSPLVKLGFLLEGRYPPAWQELQKADMVGAKTIVRDRRINEVLLEYEDMFGFTRRTWLSALPTATGNDLLLYVGYQMFPFSSKDMEWWRGVLYQVMVQTAKYTFCNAIAAHHYRYFNE